MKGQARYKIVHKAWLTAIFALTLFACTQSFIIFNSHAASALPQVVVQLFPDTLAPSIPKGGEPNGSYKTTNDFYFTWDKSTDDRPGNVDYQLRSSQDESKVGTAPDSSGAWISDVLAEPALHSSGAPDGIWYWQVRAIDAAGNKSSWSDVWKMAIDTTKPTLTISEPANGQVFNEGDQKTIAVHVFLQDDQGLAQYHIDIDGKDTGAKNETVSKDTFSGSASLTVVTLFTTTDFNDGLHVINTRVTDKAGNETRESRSIIIDTLAPSISTNINDSQEIEGVLPIKIYADEANPRVYSVSIFDESGAVVTGAYDSNSTLNSFIYNWDSTTSPNGIYKIALTARDAAGHETTAYRTVTVNNPPVEQPQPPNVTITPGVDGRTIYGTVSDSGATFTVKIDGVKRSDIVVRIGEKIDGGYVWFIELPPGIAAGVEHTIEMTAHAHGLDSSEARSTFIIDSGSGAALLPEGADPLLKQLSVSLTQPFILPNSSDAVPAPVTAEVADDEAILGAQAIKRPDGDDTKNVSVAATNGGWKIFGLYWYWWLLFGGVSGGAAWAVLRIRSRAGAMDV